MAEVNADPDPDPDSEAELDDLLVELAELEASVDSESERAQVRETMALAAKLSRPSVFGRVVSGFDRGDLAEAFLGSFLFGVPMFVEGGTLEVGAFIATNAAYVAFTSLFGVALVWGILYVAEIQDVRVANPFFGVVPRRFVGVLGTSAAMALAVMTAWGRVDWADPWLALCQCAVAFVPMAVGAALGDILPGS